jgi:hypothetical protein
MIIALHQRKGIDDASFVDPGLIVAIIASIMALGCTCLASSIDGSLSPGFRVSNNERALSTEAATC